MDVHIIDTQGHVNPDSVEVSRQNNQEVRWVANGNGNATIVFTVQGSPFQAGVFHVPAGGSVSTGVAKDDAKSISYKYTVVGPNGTNDPEVIIVG